MVLYGVLSKAAGSRLRGRYIPQLADQTAAADNARNLLAVQRGLQVRRAQRVIAR